MTEPRRDEDGKVESCAGCRHFSQYEFHETDYRDNHCEHPQATKEMRDRVNWVYEGAGCKLWEGGTDG